MINFGVCMNSNMIMVQLLDEIAELFYGVQRRNPLQGMFGDIFKVKFLTLLHLVFCNTCFAEFKYVTGLILSTGTEFDLFKCYVYNNRYNCFISTKNAILCPISMRMFSEFFLQQCV